MKIISIVGTRPQFLKLAPLCKKFKKYDNIKHIILHTGQHYDSELSEDIFKILNIPEPNYLLIKNGDSTTKVLTNMMNGIENVLKDENPDYVLVYGDCDTTLAGALVSKKLNLKLVHVEAGMRSYNKDMPEEINRILTDNISDFLLCSTKDSIINLNKENIIQNIYYVGNLQLDLLKMVIKNYNDDEILINNNLINNNFILLTIHRHYNTTQDKLIKIFNELSKLDETIIFPIHPRTKKIVNDNDIKYNNNIKLIDPVNYLDMTILERYCKYIITDSGGVQPEAWYLGKKCIILRTETEWLEPLENNTSILYTWNNSLQEFIDNFIKIKIIPNKYNENCSNNIINLFFDIYKNLK